MLLLPDEIHFRGRVPWVTFALIAANLAGFGVQLYGGKRITYGYSLSPYKITSGKDEPSPKLVKIREPVTRTVRGHTETCYVETCTTVPYAHGPEPIHLTFLTSMFMHAGWLHLLGNMWFLWIFGTMVEKRLPPGLFLVFYLACGLGAGAVQLGVEPDSVLPYVGASGAISGVMAAHLWLDPLGKLRLWFGPLLFFVYEVPVLMALPLWLLLQILSGVAVVTSGEVAGGVAYWAHVGGFATGLTFLFSLLLVLKARAARQPPPPPPVQPRPTVTLSTAAYLGRTWPVNPRDAARP